MPQFYYQAKSDPQTVVEGYLQAVNKEAAIRRIEEMGYFPIRVEEAHKKPVSSFQLFSGRITAKKITLFTRQLGTLIKSGVPILKAIEVILNQATEGIFRSTLSKIYADIKEGQNFSVALAKYPAIFSNFYISMIRTGESSGTLEKVLFRIADYQERQQAILSKIKVALMYPLIMLLVGLGTVIFMLTFVMPRLTNIFTNIGSQLPLITRIVIALSNFFKLRWPFIAVGAALILLLIRSQSRRPQGKVLLSTIKLSFPLMKRFELPKTLARFSRTLEILLKSGIPILKALGLTISTLDNEIVKKEFAKSLRDLEGGGSLGSSLKKSKLFPVFVTSLISIGEESGRLDEALGELATTYEKELEEAIQIFTTLLEPIMILLVGCVVGIVVAAMLLPIFQINIMVN